MDSTEPCILLVEDDENASRALVRLLTRRNFVVSPVFDGRSALQLLSEREVVVAIVDIQLPDTDGVSLIRRILAQSPTTECIVLTGFGGKELREEAQLAGASDYFEKPIVDSDRFFQVVRQAWKLQNLKKRLDLLGPGGPTSGILGESAAMVALRQLVEQVSDTSAQVLITGESGTGKEVVAEALHERSRRKGEFVRINCAALPEALIEAELFGAEEGSFTGQKGRRDGLFAAAEHGTLFLDEIGEMPVGLQPKLLRVLESRTYRPLGVNKERKLTARVVAATNVDLGEAIARGTFREDLYFRLAVLTVHIPPLRDRREDIPLLAAHFARKFAATEGRSNLDIRADAMDLLVAHPWPGNVRELSNVLHRAVVLSTDRIIDPEELGLAVAPATTTRHPERLAEAPRDERWLDLPFTEAKAAATRAFCQGYLAHKLALAGGSVTEAARLAGLQRPNFSREMRKFGVGSESGAEDSE
jgi:DNA-binding NtrC family response regulator